MSLYNYGMNICWKTYKIQKQLPWKNRNGYDPQNQLKAVEAEQHSIEHKLQPQHKGLQQQVVDAQHRTGHQNCNTHKQSQRALAQVPLPAWTSEFTGHYLLHGSMHFYRYKQGNQSLSSICYDDIHPLTATAGFRGSELNRESLLNSNSVPGIFTGFKLMPQKGCRIVIQI